MSSTDAVSLDALISDVRKKKTGGKDGQLASVKVLIAIFLIFVVITSKVFVNNVLSGFRGAVECRTPTSYGVVLGGIFMVIFYIIALHLIAIDVI